MDDEPGKTSRDTVSGNQSAIMTISVTSLSDTIFSLASGTLPSAVAIIRVSGIKAFNVALRIFLASLSDEPKNKRGMYYGQLVDESGNPFDDGLLLRFKGPDSFTGEDVVEFQIHGSVAIVERISHLLMSYGVRPAQRGEFSYRAFLNGKLSADRIIQLADIFQLVEEGAIESVLRSKNEGILSKRIWVLKNHLVSLQAILDTAIDFSEEYPNVISQAIQPLELVIQGCSMLINHHEATFSGVFRRKITLFGRPNAGKSSLFNAILGKYRSIVHEAAGTTRDVVEQDVVVGGVRWSLADTAGIRSYSISDAENQGIGLAEDAIRGSEIRVLVIDALDSGGDIQSLGFKPDLIVFSKIDLLPADWSPPGGSLGVSSISGLGIDRLWQEISSVCRNRMAVGEVPLMTSIQLSRIRRTVEVLNCLDRGIMGSEGPEYLSEQSRTAIKLLDEVMGGVTQDEVFDLIWSRFCIGK